FKDCLIATMFLETNNATMKLLQLAGCDIVIPKTQSCCGALHGHAGEKSGAKELAKRNIKAFEDLNITILLRMLVVAELTS
ncbi:(Fe-S)-binding protein, partial [Vibrio parahaemolyticus]|nr:(Fe-S)-binding protein [Vibrio parahaemolyticus]